MKKIKFLKNEKFNYILIKQGEKVIGIIDLKDLKEFVVDYDMDICYFNNKINEVE